MSKQSKELARSLSANRHQDLVRYLSSRLPSEEDAKDLAQEAFLRLLRLERSDLIRHPEAYLYRIATNLVHEHWLKARPESAGSDLDPEGIAAPGKSTEGLAEQKQTLDTLGRALGLLPILQRRVVLMHRRDGLTYDEIGRALNISPGMVKKYLCKGLARCRAYVRQCQND